MRHLIERLAGVLLLLALLPLLAAVATLIRTFDSAPVLFRQTRVGRNGKLFRLLKFRTMHSGRPGACVTSAGDARITRIGKILRKFKLDELPQIVNVVKGDMSFIGPRPEVPEYVDMSDTIWASVLSVKPGITDLATLMYRNEEELLGSAADPAATYRETVLPAKLALNLEHIRSRSIWSDLMLLILTVRWSLAPGGFDPRHVYRNITGKNYAG